MQPGPCTVWGERRQGTVRGAGEEGTCPCPQWPAGGGLEDLWDGHGVSMSGEAMGGGCEAGMAGLVPN